MRTVDVSLTTALTSANYAPYAKIICLVDPPTTETHDAIYFELTGTKCIVQFKKQTYVTCESFVIERGCIIAGVEVGLTTGTFYPLSAINENGIVTIEGSLFKNVLHLAVAGDNSYTDVIEDVCTEYDKTAVFKDAADAYWAYEFLEAGKFLDLNNPDHFLSIIRQKYLIFAVDNGSEDVLFYYPAKTLDSATADWKVNPPKIIYSATPTKRNLMSKDEADNAVLAYLAGVYSTYPRHNLGYIKSTDSMPRYSYPAGSYVRLDLQDFKFIMKPDLRWQDGDSIYMSDYAVLSRILVKEIWNYRHSPVWRMEVSAIQYFQGTEAGNMPADMINVAPFIPLYTGEFDGILDETDTYIQHAMDTIDDHNHDTDYSILGHDHDYVYIFGSDVDGGTVPAAGTRYMRPWAAVLSTNNTGSTFPKACTLSNLFIKTLSAQPAGQSLVITVKENGVATGITVTIAGGSAAGTFTDITNTYAFTAGRGIRFDLVQGAGAAASAQIAFITLKATLATT
jgi:hypothetical protein